MYSQHPYSAWAPRWLRDVGIIGILLLQSFVFGLNSDMAPELTGELGTQTETVKFIVQANGIGFLWALPLYYRLRKFFKRRVLLLGALLFQLPLLLLSSQLRAVFPLCILNFVLGVCKCQVTLDMIGLLMARFNPTNNRATFYGLYYSLSKPVALLADLSLIWLITQYNWKYALWLSTPAILVSVVLTLLIFHNERQHRKVPLYQVDWIGAFLFAVGCILLTFIGDFGKYYDWFDSGIIWSATLGLLVVGGLFIYRELHQKRPYWDLTIIGHYRQIRIGVLLMLILCLFFYSSSLTRQYALGLVRNDEWQLTKLTLTTLVAYAISFPLAGLWLNRQTSYRLLLVAGFVGYALSYGYLVFRIAPGIEISNLYIFYFLQGVAYALILTTLSTYASTNIVVADNPHRAFASVAARNIIGLVTAGSLWDNALFRRSALNRSNLISYLTDNNATLQEEMHMYIQRFLRAGLDSQQAEAAADQLIYRKIQSQAALLADKDLFTGLAIMAVIVVLSIPFMKGLEMHNRAKTNQYPLV